jgi:hypothetical protein
MDSLTARTLSVVDLRTTSTSTWDNNLPILSGRGSSYAKARVASREAIRVNAQTLRQAKSLSVTSTSSKPTPSCSLGEKYDWRKPVTPRNTSTMHLAFEEARSREWVAQVEAAYADQKARGHKKEWKNNSPQETDADQKFRGHKKKWKNNSPQETGGLPLSSIRHVPTRYGFTSGRCTGPLPSQTFQLSLSEQQYEIETLINARKYWRYGDFLQNRDSATV